jgi:excisionase family DNA binding protein
MRIAAHLREGIFTGRYPNYLPSTFVLSGKFGCDQSTVSRAYGVLKDEGLTHSATGHTPYVLIRIPPRFTGDGYVKVLAKGEPALFCTRCWMPSENRDRRCCGTGNATRDEPAGLQPAGLQGTGIGRLLTPPEISSDLRISLMTVNRLLNGGRLCALRVGRNWRAPEPEYRKFLITAGLAEEYAATIQVCYGPWLITVAEFAVTLHVSEMSVYKLIHSGKLQALQITGGDRGTFRLPEFECRAYLAGSVMQPLMTTGRGATPGRLEREPLRHGSPEEVLQGNTPPRLEGLLP